MIAHRIIALRKKRGWTQAQLARRLHITSSAEGNYEQGRRLPPVEILVSISKLFNVSLDYLITGVEFVSSDELPNEPKKHTCPCDSCFWKDYK